MSATTLGLTDRVAPRPDVIFRALGSDAIVLDIDGGMYYGLDEVGCRIWGLAGGHTLEGISQALTSEFEVGLDQARHDVLALVQTLVDRGLMSRVDHAPD
jgi:hypothetical protein